MIKYNFERIFRARGIARPFSFLKRNGFSDNFASRIKNNKVVRLDLTHLEKLCFILKCNPNDLLEWTPEKDMDYDDNHPLNMIKKTSTEVNLVKTISSIPLNKLAEIESMIKEKIQGTE